MMNRVLFYVAAIALASSAPSPKLHVPTLDGRIVGGEDVSIENYNYQAALLYFGSHRCGAVILTEYVVLTAAHCTDQ